MRWDAIDETGRDGGDDGGEEDGEIARKRDVSLIRHRAVVLRGGVIGGS